MNDLKFAFRQLLKNPGFTAVAVLTLALGIGANTAIFSLVNAVLLRPLPYPESERLVWLAERGLDWPAGDHGSISYPNFTDWKTQQSVFEHFGVYNWNNFAFTGRGEPAQLKGAQVSVDVFAALRVQPVLGRLFNPDEDKPGAAPVVVISHSLWQSRFGGDPNIVNQTIRLDTRAHTVVGVMPAHFAFPNQVDLWVPIGPLSAEASWQDRNNHPGLLGLARLKPGVTLQQARVELDTIATRLDQQYPASNKNRRVRLDSLLDREVGDVRRPLWTLLGAVGLVLLIACANVANLLLARAAARQKEMSVRAALGASRWRIVRQLITESLLLAGAGAAFGLLLAQGALRVILSMAVSIPRSTEIDLDGPVLLFSAALAVCTGVVFGLAPAWQASRADLQDALKTSARGTTRGRGQLRHGLVVAEVAMTLLLLVGAGLFIRSFHHLLKVNPGFSYERVLTFRITLSERKYSRVEQQTQFLQALLQKLVALPGVQTASLATQIPLDQNGWDTSFVIDGRTEPPPHEQPSMEVHLVGTDYFRTMGIPVLRGRVFTEQDNAEHLRGTGREQEWAAGLKVMIVDEEFARRHWPNENPIGQRVRLPGWRENPVLTVVGVVGRVREERINEQGGNVQAYFPFLQMVSRSVVVAIRTSLEPRSLTAAVHQQVLALDPDQPIFDICTMAELRDQSIAPDRLNLTLLGLFAGVALALAAIGLYGVLAYGVAQRTQEIGVRMALGAQRRDVLGLVVGQGMRLTILGVMIGLLGAWALTRVLSKLLYEVEPTDPLTFAGVSILLAGIALLSCWLPARRAANVDPIEALRYE